MISRVERYLIDIRRNRHDVVPPGMEGWNDDPEKRSVISAQQRTMIEARFRKKNAMQDEAKKACKLGPEDDDSVMALNNGPSRFKDSFDKSVAVLAVADDDLSYLRCRDFAIKSYGRNESDFTRAKFRSAMRKITPLLSIPKITIYRYMGLPKSFVMDLRPNTILGQSWAYKRSRYLYQEADITVEPLAWLVTATIRNEDISWLDTIVLDTMFVYEYEIRPVAGSGVLFESIVQYDPDSGRILTPNVRPDLVGKAMKTWTRKSPHKRFEWGV